MEEAEKVCVELDRVLVELMDCLDQLSILRRQFSTVISEGYFNMAKARYSMGPLSVGTTQYDTVMTAGCLVDSEPSGPVEDDGDQMANTDNTEDDGDEMANTDNAEGDGDKMANTDNTEGVEKQYSVFRVYRNGSRTVMRGGQSSVAREEEGQPRRRRPQTGEPEPGGQEFNIDDIIMRRRDLESDEQEGREREGRKNPLNWFGILVPQNLRQSQQNFIKALELCGEVATEQSKLEQLRTHYQTLTLRKQHLETMMS